MDMIKIGQFLAELRREQNLTQEQLGEEIGVTNKTVSRWENGNYLPPVEMLQILSRKYDVSINELLSGERLDGTAYKMKAEENITATLKNSVFTAKERRQFFEKKWLKEHSAEMVIEMIFLIALAVVGAIFLRELCVAATVLCLIWSLWIHNRQADYVEGHIAEEAQNQNGEQAQEGHKTKRK